MLAWITETYAYLTRTMTFCVSCTALLVFRIQVDMSALMDYLTGASEAIAMLMQRLDTSK